MARQRSRSATTQAADADTTCTTAASRKRGRPVDPSSKRQLKLAERARLLEEDPAARAERYWEEQAAACAVESARRLKIMRLHRHGAATGGSAGVVMTLRRRRVFEGG